MYPLHKTGRDASIRTQLSYMWDYSKAHRTRENLHPLTCVLYCAEDHHKNELGGLIRTN